MSIAQFDQIIAPNIASLSTAAITGLTAAQLNSLSATQISNFTAAQMAAFNSTQISALYAKSAIAADITAHEVNGALSFSGAQAVLQDAAVGGMNTLKFSELEQVASKLNSTGGVTTSAVVQQLFDDVVLGNAANAYWNGGSTTATKLGNLSATSTQTQTNELIGKWFLGTDDPSLAGFSGDAYKNVTESLFSSTGPALTDVNQGSDGDCYFLAALGETAMLNPSLIQNMITTNSNGSYTVEFWQNNKPDYVTVDGSFAMMPSSQSYDDGSHWAFDHGTNAGAGNDWTAIVEKAYVEFRSQTDGVNSYQDISGGSDNGLQAITGQQDTLLALLTIGASASTQEANMLSTMQSALANHQEVIMGSVNQDLADNLVGNHMYAVTAVNAATGMVSLDNPWNGSGATSGLKMQFNDSISMVCNLNDMFCVTTGAKQAA